MQFMRSRRHALVLIVAFAMALIAPLGASAIAPDDDPGSPVHLSNAAIATTLFSAVFNGDSDPGSLIAADAVIHTQRGDFTGPDGLREYLDGLDANYPDASWDVTSTVIEGDSVVVQWTMTATRFQLTPNADPINVLVSIPGETTIAVDGGQVATLTQAEHGTAVQMAEEYAVASGHVHIP